MFIVLSSCLLYPIMSIQSYLIYRDINLNQNVNVTKRARFATFALSILDKFCLLQRCKWNTIKIRLPRLIINAPFRTRFSGRCRM